MKIIDKPGTADVGEFSPLVTPLETPEVVTTAHTQVTLHSITPADPGPTGKMTETHMPSTTPVRK
jgi:hypothetical protein